MPPKNFNNYDVTSQGGAGFDIKDRRYLKQQGASRKQIGKVRNSYYDGGGQRTNAQNEQKRIKGMGPIDSSQPISNFDVGNKYGIQDIKALRKAGYDDQQIAEDFAQRGGKMNKNIRRQFKQAGVLDSAKSGIKSRRAEAKEKAQNYQDNSNSNNNNTTNSNNNNNNTTDSYNNNDSFNSQTDNSINDSMNTNDSFNSADDNSINDSFNTNLQANTEDSYNTTDSYNNNDSFNTNISTDRSYNTDASTNDSYNKTNSDNTSYSNMFNRTNTNSNNYDNSSEFGDVNSNIGKQGDINTNIQNSNFGAGANFGNDYSVTIGNQMYGNNGGQNSAGSTNAGLSNMQGAAAYSALNNNQWAQSNSQMNGYSRAAGAVEEANRMTNATNTAANIYNMAGMTQNYWNNKATAQQGFYLGDIYGNQQTAPWKQPPSPDKPEDKTEEIADNLKF